MCAPALFVNVSPVTMCALTHPLPSLERLAVLAEQHSFDYSSQFTDGEYVKICATCNSLCGSKSQDWRPKSRPRGNNNSPWSLTFLYRSHSVFLALSLVIDMLQILNLF